MPLNTKEKRPNDSHAVDISLSAQGDSRDQLRKSVLPFEITNLRIAIDGQCAEITMRQMEFCRRRCVTKGGIY
jgi:hypothetical protein